MIFLMYDFINMAYLNLLKFENVFLSCGFFSLVYRYIFINVMNRHAVTKDALIY